MQENRYDVDSLRFELLENGRRTSFAYHNGKLLHEEGGENRTSYYLGAGLDALQRGQDLSYYHCDEQFSTAFITGADREIQNSYLYDAFGDELEVKEQLQNRIRYTGQQYDDLTGQYYLRARYYNPVLGRFMQEDVYQGDGLNLYAYCGNNPVVYSDPSGYAETPQTGNECPPDAKIAESGNSAGDNRADFYVTPDGEVVPSTGYRYMSSDNASDALNTGEQYATYIGFEKFDSASEVQDAFQIAPEWSDCKVRGTFDTLQVIDDMYVPTTLGNTTTTPEPFAVSYPQYGEGGAQQFRVDKVIEFLEVEIIGD